MTDLSFVIPVYNESLFISKCLRIIRQLSERNQLNVEIIVINNGSTDDSVELAGAYTDKIFTIDRGSVSAARNKGIEISKSELIAFIDADVMLTQQWFDCFKSNRMHYLQDLNFLTGYQYAVRPDGSWIERHWFSNLKDAMLNGGNIITSRQVCDLLGGFAVNLKTGEDYDFCARAIRVDVQYSEEPGYVSIHDGFPRDLVNFFRREYWHGEGDFLSFKVFMKSIVAVLGAGYLSMLMLIFILLINGFYLVGLSVALVLLAGNLVITVKRFGKLPVVSIVCNSVLNFIYFVARGLSFFKAIRNRSNAY